MNKTKLYIEINTYRNEFVGTTVTTYKEATDIYCTAKILILLECQIPASGD